MTREPVWEQEPQEDQRWTTEAGLPAIALRGPVGAWCGYVGVAPDHPLYGKDYSAWVKVTEKLMNRMVDRDKVSPVAIFGLIAREEKAEDELSLDLIFQVHGGLTYAGQDERRGLNFWWFGFDCAHAFDYSPGMSKYHLDDPEETYRTLEYVKQECESLARQLVDYESVPEEAGP